MSNRSSNPSTYTEVAVKVLSSSRRRLSAAEIFENARKNGLLRRFTAQGRTLQQVKVGLSAKLRQSVGNGGSLISVRKQNGVNMYSI